MNTIIKNASVKIMLSYDYSHFESSLSIEKDSGLTLKEIDDARKDCQRLADKAVAQYKTAKEHAAARVDGIYKIQNFKFECESIKKKDESDRTLKEIAMLKQYENENWQAQFENNYDYDDDDDQFDFLISD